MSETAIVSNRVVVSKTGGADWAQHQDPLARLPGETTKANAALRDYAHMGVRRAVRPLYRTYRDEARAASRGAQGDGQGADAASTKKRRPCTQLKTLYDWAVFWDWTPRVERWDDLEREREADTFERERTEWRRRRIEAAKDAFNFLSKSLLLLMEQHPEGVVMDFDDLVGAMVSIHKMLRAEFGDDVQQVDVTSGGKAIAITEVRVHLREGGE